MVLCIIAAAAFAILSIFSAKYRPLAKEAFGCVFRMATLRGCETGFDTKLKARVVSNVFERSPSAAKFINVHFESLSWIFTILFFASTLYTAYGAYNWIAYGTCDPQHPESCILTQLTNSSVNIQPGQCTITADFAEFYGAECPHCKKMAPILADVEKETGIVFEKLEVWHNDSNAQVMMLHKDEILRDCKYDASTRPVPVFLSIKNRKAVCGELSKDALKQFVLQNN